jgi:HPt (histidine-containing phosphotransfer) domain-containing protein
MPTRAMKTVPVLDRDHLLEMTEGDVAFEHELLSTYRASVENIVARLGVALSTGNLAQVVREAHALRGASLNVGATAMGQCAGAIEAAARAGDLALVNQAALKLDAEAAALRAELDRM